MPAKRTEPSKNATHQNAGFKYVNSVSTDLRKTFAAARRRRLTLAKRAAEGAQARLDLDTGAQVLPFKAAGAA